MGKVRDDAAAEKPAKAAVKGTPGRRAPSWLSGFVANFLRSDPYKPSQGWHARMLTAVGLALLVKGHDNYRGAVAAHSLGVLDEGGLALLHRD